MRFASRCLAVLSGAVLFSTVALAQPFPNKPIKAIVPFAAGSATDQIGRAFAAKMSETLGQTIVIENKPGVERACWAPTRWPRPRLTATPS
jgi:tripartite-type tricarboxylate transporter receptor subunit TctC